MKKFLALLLSAALIASCLSGCQLFGKPSSDDKKTTSSEADTQQDTQSEDEASDVESEEEKVDDDTSEEEKNDAEPAVKLTQAQAKSIASKLIGAFETYSFLGIFCDVEYVEGDMSQYLTEAQRENYFNMQYKIKCCHSVAEVKAHFARSVDPSILPAFDSSDLFVGENNVVYSTVVPTGALMLDDLKIDGFNDTKIFASIKEYELGMEYMGTYQFVFTKDPEFKITKIGYIR